MVPLIWNRRNAWTATSASGSWVVMGDGAARGQVRVRVADRVTARLHDVEPRRDSVVDARGHGEVALGEARAIIRRCARMMVARFRLVRAARLQADRAAVVRQREMVRGPRPWARRSPAGGDGRRRPDGPPSGIPRGPGHGLPRQSTARIRRRRSRASLSPRSPGHSPSPRNMFGSQARKLCAPGPWASGTADRREARGPGRPTCAAASIAQHPERAHHGPVRISRGLPGRGHDASQKRPGLGVASLGAVEHRQPHVRLDRVGTDASSAWNLALGVRFAAQPGQAVAELEMQAAHDQPRSPLRDLGRPLESGAPPPRSGPAAARGRPGRSGSSRAARSAARLRRANVGGLRPAAARPSSPGPGSRSCARLLAGRDLRVAGWPGSMRPSSP